MEIVYFHTANSDYVRVKKVMESFSKKNDNIMFYGAVRATEKWNDQENSIFSGISLPHGIKSFFSYLLYVYRAVIFLRKSSAKVVIVTNEELMIIPLLAKFKGYVCLDALDALDIRRSGSLLTKVFTKMVRRLSDLIIEVESFRSDRFPEFRYKTVVIRNIPLKNENELPQSECKVQHISKPFIFAYGSLQKVINGMEELLTALDKINENKHRCSLVIAGSIADKELLSDMDARSYVYYAGKITSFECMNIASKSIGVFAYYKPVNLNFIMAAPNKFYEAQMCNVPLLMNSECIISKSTGASDFCVTAEYNDCGALYDNIANLLENGSSLKKRIYTDSWEGDFDNFYERLVDELSNI